MVSRGKVTTQATTPANPPDTAISTGDSAEFDASCLEIRYWLTSSYVKNTIHTQDLLEK